MKESMDIDQLIENIFGVIHSMKSSLMAVNGYIDLLAPEKTGEIYENAKNSTEKLETVINNLVFALRAYRNTEPADISLNQYVKSAVELIRSNKTFRSKVKFSLELTENDMIHAVPAEVLDRLVACISEEAMRMLNGGEYRVTVGTAYEDGQRSIRIGNAVSTFRYRSPDSPKVSGDLLSPCRCTVTPATPHGRGATAASKTPPGPSPLRA